MGAMLVVLPSRVVANDHRPPPAPHLTIGEVSQRGRLIHSSWLSPYDRQFCEQSVGSSSVTFPTALPYVGGDVADITLRKVAPPWEWSVRAWTRVNKAGRPRGNADVVPAVLVPVRRGTGQPPRAWRLSFAPPLTGRHWYVRVDAYWADENECSSTLDLGSQSASWTYHLRLREAATGLR